MHAATREKNRNQIGDFLYLFRWCIRRFFLAEPKAVRRYDHGAEMVGDLLVFYAQFYNSRV